MKLSEAQSRNLSRLSEIEAFTFVDHARLEKPRRPTFSQPYRWENEQGHRKTHTQKASHKGFHRDALDSLVDLGLVTRTVEPTGKRHCAEHGDWMKEIGDHSTTTITYRVA